MRPCTCDYDPFELRSGGPMAATVDRVMRRCANHGPQIQEWSFTEFDAAIRRAAEKAALTMCKRVEEDEFLHAKSCAEDIERHVRQELGL